MPHRTRDLITRRNYDHVDFDERDERDEQHDELLRAVLFGLPPRPGTRRTHATAPPCGARPNRRPLDCPHASIGASE
ncbi:hypothetical protein KRMM14A1259_22190 [Krasilnikovia sp. MM14-A1259]